MTKRTRLTPGLQVACELGRALLELVILPLRLVRFSLGQRRLSQEVRELLQRAPGAVQEPQAPGQRKPGRGEWSVFIACAEASGEIHAVNLVHALRRNAAEQGRPEPRLLGLGGPRLAAAGVEILADPVTNSNMGLRVLGALPFYLRLLRDCARLFGTEQPEVVIGVDSPALHVPMFRLARRAGLPTVHFVTPQYWGWGPWRVSKYSRAVDLGLSILPFEPAWYASRGVAAKYVGHPLLDELREIPNSAQATPRERLVLLAGSRGSVLGRNLPWILELATAFLEHHPNAEVVLAQGRTEWAERMGEWLEGADPRIRLEAGDLHGSLRGARAAVSVSGTILLDLLHHRLPTVVVYRLGSRFEAWMAPRLLSVPYFAVVNLLTGEQTCPEYCFAGDGPRAQALEDLLALWSDGRAREDCLAGLERAAQRLGPPGAVDRAADWALATALKKGGNSTQVP